MEVPSDLPTTSQPLATPSISLPPTEPTDMNCGQTEWCTPKSPTREIRLKDEVQPSVLPHPPSRKRALQNHWKSFLWHYKFSIEWCSYRDTICKYRGISDQYPLSMNHW